MIERRIVNRVGRGWPCTLVGCAVLAQACGDDSNAGTTFPSGGAGGRAAGAGGAGGDSSMGGGGAAGQADAGDGGTPQGGGGAAGGAPERPVAPVWEPPFPLAGPGWKESTDLLCTERYGLVGGPRVWSDADKVYALVSAECNELANVACGGEGTSLYANDGTGWSSLYRVDPNHTDAGLMGAAGGPLFVFGNDCGITRVERDGTATCSYEDANFDGVRDLFTAPGDTAYALVGEHLIKYDGNAWSPLADLPVGVSGAIWADDSTIVVAAFDQYVARVDPASGQVTPLSGVIAGDYTDVWGFGDDVWLVNRVGQLVHFDGATWTTVETGLSDLLGLWGSPDGTLYFYSSSGFGRRYNDQIELLAQSGAASTDIYFNSLWGNSTTEVFLGVRDNSFRDYQCSGAFTVFFDGSELHLF